jgi:hypothetical protein
MFESFEEEKEQFKEETEILIRELEQEFENEIIKLERFLKSTLKQVIYIFVNVSLLLKYLVVLKENCCFQFFS